MASLEAKTGRKEKLRMKIYPVGVLSSFSDNTQKVEVFSDLSPGLEGIENSKHLWILYWFHQLPEEKRKVLQVHPHGDSRGAQRGIFATRSPARPNPIGLAKAQLVRREDNILTVKGLDALIDSPVSDIKPF